MIWEVNFQARQEAPWPLYFLAYDYTPTKSRRMDGAVIQMDMGRKWQFWHDQYNDQAIMISKRFGGGYGTCVT